MSEADGLHSISEIAITIAGFAALVNILGSRANDVNVEAAGLRLIVALEASLFVAAFALTPLVPAKNRCTHAGRLAPSGTSPAGRRTAHGR